jgi:CheY-like chemotaxis protein
MLDLSSIEQGLRQLEYSPQLVTTAIHDCVMLVEPIAEERRVSLSLPNIPSEVAVSADARAMGQVLLNLLSNAIKYSPIGSTVTVAIDLRTAEVGITIIDQGPGLSDAQSDQLFQPFNRLGAEKTAVKGSGLGLVISRQLAGAMGGRIQVVSAVGEGSRFTLWLPRATRAAPIANNSPPEVVVEAAIGHATVLYVEDDLASAMLVKSALDDLANVTVYLATNGSEGLKIAEAVNPSIIMSDLDMPVMGGIEFVQAIRRHPSLSRTTCIALTSETASEQTKTALAAGFDNYWTKPLDIAALRSNLARLTTN